MERRIVNPNELEIELRRDKLDKEKVVNLYSNLSVPSYVHGYSLAIEYMVDWFERGFTPEKGFPEGYLKGGIYVDGKHVLDDYKKYSRAVIVGQNPRARVEPKLDFDYDRENIDLYVATPEVLIRRSDYNKSFYRDYDRKLFLGMDMNQMKMNFNFKIRVNTRAQQLDCWNKMKMNYRVGSTQHELLSADFHIPKLILTKVAEKAGFDITADGEIEDPISFLEYMNSYSDIPFLFKMRAINQKPEFFIRLNDLYVDIFINDRLQPDDGERDGKLDMNYHIEMNCEMYMPIPAYYIFYSGDDFKLPIKLKEMDKNTIPIYSFNAYELPKVDEHGWTEALNTEYLTDDYQNEIDISELFKGDNSLARAVNHDLTRGISPKHFLNLKVIRKSIPAGIDGYMDWSTMIYHIEEPLESETLMMAIYMDREYINQLDITLGNLYNSRVQVENKK